MTTPTPHGAPELLPCPFCGNPPDARWTRANPKARCRTENCKGSQLPVVNLDQPDDIAAWNTRAAIQQAAGAVPEGWKLVPVEPTPEMIAAGHVGDALGCDVDAKDAKAVYGGAYSAMLAASPSPLGREAGKEGSSDHLVPCAGDRVQVPRLFDHPMKKHYPQCSDCALAYQNMADDCGWGCDGRSMFVQRIAPAPRPDATPGQINPGSAPREDGHG